MRKLEALSAALLCLSFSAIGCGVLGEDEEPAPAEQTGAETFSAPFGSGSNDSEGSDQTAPTSADTATKASDDDANDPDSKGDDTSDDAAKSKADPGPAPSAQCSIEKDKSGFFTRTSSKSGYVAYVPASYSSKAPMRVIVGLHGCSDNAYNFATWGVNPSATRAKQNWIGISVSGETGNNKCWSMGNDDDKVLAAVEDLAKCFWIDRSKVVVGGFSSGGQLAYRVGMKHASSFAGILIENSGLYAAGIPAADLLGKAAWKLPVAHRAHTQDSVFPIAKVKADWSLTKGAGFPITTSELAGPHDGNGDDWASWLIPQSAAWVRK